LMDGGGKPSSLVIGDAGDEFEQEADRVASGQQQPARVQLQTYRQSPARDARQAAPPPSLREVLSSPGSPLEQSARTSMESRFGYDFSQVRVHTDARAAESALDVGAEAYTVGRDVVFGPGRYSPSTSAGRRLLAHELAHVVQQGSGGERVQRGGKLITLTKQEELEWDLGILRYEMEHFDKLSTEEKLVNMERIMGWLQRISTNPHFADMDPDVQRDITGHIAAIEATLKAFAKARSENVETVEESRFSPVVMGAIAVSDGPEPFVMDAVALLYAAGALLAGGTAVQVARDPELVRRQARALSEMLGDVRATLGAAVLMTAVGGVIHDHIVDEARELAVAAGLAATAGAVTLDMLCEMLRQMANKVRRSDSEKWKKIIATQKGLGCRGSRANRE
jgi:hypothetical protein